MVEAILRIIESKVGCQSRRWQHRKLRIFAAMTTIKRVVAGSGNHSAGKLVAASPIRFWQLRKIRFPTQLDRLLRSNGMGRAPRRRDDRRDDRHHDSKKQR